MSIYSLPAEWSSHRAVWLAWPYEELCFPGRVAQVQSAVVKIVSALAEGEHVELLVLDEHMKANASALLAASGVRLNQISFRVAKYLGGWMRDCGPMFVKNPARQLALVKWIFNQWGVKSITKISDDKLPDNIKQWLELEMQQPQLVLEGGAVEVNGQGLCLTTEQCVLNENRNRGKTKLDVEKFLADYLGIKKTIWLWKGLTNDNTDGHVDELARFVSENKILCAYEDNEQDENYAILKNNYETLVNETDLNGQKFEVIKLPMPHLLFDDKSKAPVSYANFYIGNKAVLVPSYNDPNDLKAQQIIQSCFPGRKIVPIDCRDIIYGGGAVHCMTLQEPT